METNVKADPFVQSLSTRVVEAGASRVVVEQPDEPELGNHVGVRHASALHAAGYEAGRTLVTTALGEHAAGMSVRLVETEVGYTRVAFGPLEFVAVPAGEGWPPGSPEPVRLATSTTATDENGKTVATMEAVWSVEPA